MSRCSRVAIGSVLLALVAVPAADARVAAQRERREKPSLRLSEHASLPEGLGPGRCARARARPVANLPEEPQEVGAARLHPPQHAEREALHPPPDREDQAPPARADRSFDLRMTVPDLARPGAYYLRTCVRHAASTKGSCRSRRLRVTDRARPDAPRARRRPARRRPARRRPARPRHHRSHKHSLRAPLTGENLLRHGRPLQERRRGQRHRRDRPATPDAHGFDPTRKGYFHGGDLKGLLSKIDYIEGLGTTAIWLTPSFKNRPVQGPPGKSSAGYHGYWVTDFTQIDPHFGTNEDLRKADRGGAREGDQGLLRHHHQPHRGRHLLRGAELQLHPEGHGPYKTAPARRSTTATTRARAASRRSTRRRASRTRPSTPPASRRCRPG